MLFFLFFLSLKLHTYSQFRKHLSNQRHVSSHTPKEDSHISKTIQNDQITCKADLNAENDFSNIFNVSVSSNTEISLVNCTNQTQTISLTGRIIKNVRVTGNSTILKGLIYIFNSNFECTVNSFLRSSATSNQGQIFHFAGDYGHHLISGTAFDTCGVDVTYWYDYVTKTGPSLIHCGSDSSHHLTCVSFTDNFPNIRSVCIASMGILSIENTTFFNSTSNNRGGAVCIHQSNNASIFNSTFKCCKNYEEGSAINYHANNYVNDQTPILSIIKCHFINWNYFSGMTYRSVILLDVGDLIFEDNFISFTDSLRISFLRIYRPGKYHINRNTFKNIYDLGMTSGQYLSLCICYDGVIRSSQPPQISPDKEEFELIGNVFDNITSKRQGRCLWLQLFKNEHIFQGNQFLNCNLPNTSGGYNMGLIEINFHQFISDTLIFRDFIFDNCRINESRGYASLLFIQNSDSRGSPMPFTLQMERCTFTQLSSNQRGGGFQLGGTAYNFNININYNAYTSLNLNNCTFAHNYTPKEGGAISLIVLSPIIITNCIFRNNTGSQGGAFYIRTYFNNESLPHCTITNCTFIENEDINSSTNSVLYFDNLDQAETETNIVISKCTFYNNLKSHSNNGYCISGPARSFVIEGNHFNNDNNIDSSCGAFFTERRSMLNISNNYFVQCNPHAIYYLPLSGHDNEEEIVIINCTFDSNNADKIGLAIHLFNLANSNLILSNLSFLNHNTDKLLIYITSLITPNEIRLSYFNFINNTYRGSSNCGGIGIDFNKVPSLIFYHCIFESNFSPSKGGAIHLSNSKIEFDGCDFSRNSATFDGGACYFEQNNSVVMTNCVFNENQASNNGGAIVAQSNIAITGCHFSNCKSHNSQFYIHTH